MNVDQVLLILAFIMFILSAAEVPAPKVNLQSLGLAFWVLTLLV